MSFSDILSIFISIFALGFSFFAYFHSRNYEKNNLEIERIKKELNKDKKANLIGKIKKVNIPNSSVEYKLQIKNIGKAVAENVRIQLMEKKNGISVLEKSKMPLDKLYPEQNIKLITSVSYGSSGSTSKIKIKFIWDDKYKKNRSEIKEVLIN